MKRIISVFLAMLLCLGTLCVTATAEEPIVIFDMGCENVALGVQYSITSDNEDGAPVYNVPFDDNVGQGFYLSDGVMRDVEQLTDAGVGDINKTIELAGIKRIHYITFEFDCNYTLYAVAIGTARRAWNRCTNVCSVEVYTDGVWSEVEYTETVQAIEGASQCYVYEEGWTGSHDQFFNILLDFTAPQKATAIRVGVDTEDTTGIISYYSSIYDSHGYIVQLDEIQVYGTKFDPKHGDVNLDNAVDNMDAAEILKYDAGIKELPLSLMSFADVNGDGFVDNIDAAMILKYDAGIIDRIGSNYVTTEKKTNYALGKSYTLIRDGSETDPNYLYLNYATGNAAWSDLHLIKMTDGIVGDIADDEYYSRGAKEDVTVQLVGTNRLFEYIIDLGNYYGDISSFVFRNIRNSMPYGGNRGFKLRLAYVSDDCLNWTRLTGSVAAEEVEGAPEMMSNFDPSVTNVEHFNYTYNLNEPAQGRYVRIIITSDGGYVTQLEEIEIWN